jgi:hypothetical protein
MKFRYRRGRHTTQLTNLAKAAPLQRQTCKWCAATLVRRPSVCIPIDHLRFGSDLVLALSTKNDLTSRTGKLVQFGSLMSAFLCFQRAFVSFSGVGQPLPPRQRLVVPVLSAHRSFERAEGLTRCYATGSRCRIRADWHFERAQPSQADRNCRILKWVRHSVQMHEGAIWLLRNS